MWLVCCVINSNAHSQNTTSIVPSQIPESVMDAPPILDTGAASATWFASASPSVKRSVSTTEDSSSPGDSVGPSNITHTRDLQYPETLISKYVQQWDKNDVKNFLNENKGGFHLDDEDIAKIFVQKVSGHGFLQLTEEKLSHCPFELSFGPAVEIAELVKLLKRDNETRSEPGKSRVCRQHTRYVCMCYVVIA
ncbi:hypothetical protein BC938DRAFT_474688 [Jimgerdemannia flammicorona]|uniref:SAM domain-containing protein n=1 Tax=Jimgerdemannia flammicorona TaxID=994334 RepID=A0A433QSC9_9FUNG|nr:hypothetical protein BC938DRAFT_474688 [Jimgerdemannia flammicorona]